jgi:hypothetical protein
MNEPTLRVDRVFLPAGVFALIAFSILTGCSGAHSIGRGSQSANILPSQRVDLLLPKTIDITPFTKPASFDDDSIPDGIKVVLRPLDAFGDPIKVVGTFRFELYEFHKASADIRGLRLAVWDVDLSTEQAQEQHWDRYPPTYRFRLGWPKGVRIERGKYVLEATYISPWGERLSSTYVIDAELPRAKMKPKTEI